MRDPQQDHMRSSGLGAVAFALMIASIVGFGALATVTRIIGAAAIPIWVFAALAAVAIFKGPFAAGGGFDRDSGNAALASGAADFIVFGKLFTSNPDLPARFATGAPLVDFDPTTFYSPGPKGYIDYASL